MGTGLPRAPRIASPSFDRSIGLDVLAIGVVSLAAPLVVPSIGGYVMLVGLVIAAFTAMRRRTMGAYETDDALVVRNYLTTARVDWPTARSVERRRDPWLPWLSVAELRREGDASSVVVTALRYRGTPPSPVLALTRIVRDRRERRSREVWDR